MKYKKYNMLEIMKVNDLIVLMNQLSEEQMGKFEVWLSKDEEGNEFLPLFKRTDLCLEIDVKQKKIILFPAHR